MESESKELECFSVYSDSFYDSVAHDLKTV